MNAVDSMIDIGLWMDNLIYSAISAVYNLIIDLAQYHVFSQDAIGNVSRKIYALTGIFMLFKVTISMITYLVNPDDFSDKTKGFSGMFKRIIISLVLMVATPYIFNEAYYVQKMVLEDGTIMKIFLTTSEGGSAAGMSFSGDKPGRVIQFTLFSQFVRPNTDLLELSDCKQIYEYDDNGDRKMDGAHYVFSDKCHNALETVLASSDLNSDSSASSLLSTYENGMKYQIFSLIASKTKNDLYTAKVDSTDPTTGDSINARVFSYRWPLSTIVGLVTLLILFTMCFDIAVRSIKLGFYQIIAPIPILSNVDPKSSKNGMMQKWSKACVETYLDLFLRLFGLYLGLTVIFAIIDSNKFQGFGSIVLIIGGLMFAKQLPKIIEDIFGLKLDGKFQLNPIKKIETEALGGKALTGAAAGAAVGMVGAATGAGIFRPFTNAIGGAASNKGFAAAWKDSVDKNTKYRRANNIDRNPIRRFGGRIATGITDAVGAGGLQAAAEREESNIQRRIDNLKAQKESTEAAIQPIKTIMNRRKETYGKINAMQDRAVSKVKQGKGVAGATYQDFLQKSEGVRQSTSSTGSVTLRGGRVLTWSNEAERGALAERLSQEAEKYANTTGRDIYMNESQRTAGFDDTLENLRKEYTASATEYGYTVYTNAKDLDTQQGDLKTENTNDGISISAQEREIQDYNDQIQEQNDRLRDVRDNKTRYESYRIK